jgi:hypothetical protein
VQPFAEITSLGHTTGDKCSEAQESHLLLLYYGDHFGGEHGGAKRFDLIPRGIEELSEQEEGAFIRRIAGRTACYVHFGWGVGAIVVSQSSCRGGVWQETRRRIPVAAHICRARQGKPSAKSPPGDRQVLYW